MFPSDINKSSSPTPPERAPQGSSGQGKKSPAIGGHDDIGRAFKQFSRNVKEEFRKFGALFSNVQRNNFRATQASPSLSEHNIVPRNAKSVGNVSRVAHNVLQSLSPQSASQLSPRSEGSTPTSSKSPPTISSEFFLSPEAVVEVGRIEGKSGASSPTKIAESFSDPEKGYLLQVKNGGTEILNELGRMKGMLSGDQKSLLNQFEKRVKVYTKIPTEENLNQLKEHLKGIVDDSSFEGKFNEIATKITSIINSIPKEESLPLEKLTPATNLGGGASPTSRGSSQRSTPSKPRSILKVKASRPEFEDTLLMGRIKQSKTSLRSVEEWLEKNSSTNESGRLKSIKSEVSKMIQDLKVDLEASLKSDHTSRVIKGMGAKLNNFQSLFSEHMSALPLELKQKMSDLSNDLKPLQINPEERISPEFEYRILLSSIETSYMSLTEFQSVLEDNISTTTNEESKAQMNDLLEIIRGLQGDLQQSLESENPRLLKRMGTKLGDLEDFVLELDSPLPEPLGSSLNFLLEDLKDLQSISYRSLDLTVLKGVAPLASGGTATVLTSPRSPKEVVKVFKNKLSKTDIANLTGESGKEVARRLIALDHPNLVPIYEITYKEDGTPRTIDMPRIEGTALFKGGEYIRGIENNPMKWSIAKQVCSGLTHMHKMGLVHRDVQAKNIIINLDKEVFLCDMDSAYLKGKEIEKSAEYLFPPEYRFTQEEEESIKTQSIENVQRGSSEKPREIEYPKQRITEKFDSWQYGLFLADLFLNKQPGKNKETLSSICFSSPQNEEIQKEYDNNLGKYISEKFGLTEPLSEILIGLLHPDPLQRLSLEAIESRFKTSEF